MNTLRVCINGHTVYHAPAAGVRCTGISIYVDNGTSTDWFYRCRTPVTIDWL